MSKKYTTYDPSTGEILSCVSCVNVMLPPQGEHFGFGIIYGESDPRLDRVEHGRIVRKGMLARKQLEVSEGWFALRERRRLLMDKTQMMIGDDYPLTAVEKKALRLKRSKSRKIPQKVNDPVKALELLERIWGADDVE